MRTLLSFAFVLTMTLVCLALDNRELERLLRRTKRPELPYVVKRIVLEAPPALRKQEASKALQIVKIEAPAALDAVLEALPLECRPESTPGTEHGKRPLIPPGLLNYGKP